MKYRVIKRNYLSFARNVGDEVEIADEKLVKVALEDGAIVAVEEAKEEKAAEAPKASKVSRVKKAITRKKAE